MIAVTGANGQLGRQVLRALARLAPQTPVIAAVRSPEKALELASDTVTLRLADYDQPATLENAFQGVRTLLLISSSEIGQRARQHQAAIDAAVKAGVRHIVYTSLLNADSSPMQLAQEHRDTEALLRQSGLQTIILRNSWYLENYADAVRNAAQTGVLAGAAGAGRVNAATRADYAEAAARILIDPDAHNGKLYELAGTLSFSMTELAAAIAEFSGRPIAYSDLPKADYAALLIKFGLPDAVANLLADSDAAISQGALESDSQDLAQLLGRPPMPWRTVIDGFLSGA